MFQKIYDAVRYHMDRFHSMFYMIYPIVCFHMVNNNTVLYYCLVSMFRDLSLPGIP